METLKQARKLLQKAWKRQDIEIEGDLNNPFWMSAGALLEFKLRVETGRTRRDGSKEYLILDVDILVNKILEAYNSELIRTYCW